MPYTSGVSDVRRIYKRLSGVFPHGAQQTTGDAQKSVQGVTPFSQEEIELIDRWGFAKQIRNRADAVRSLVKKALASEGIRRDAG
jgi:hypothetical protein